MAALTACAVSGASQFSLSIVLAGSSSIVNPQVDDVCDNYCAYESAGQIQRGDVAGYENSDEDSCHCNRENDGQNLEKKRCYEYRVSHHLAPAATAFRRRIIPTVPEASNNKPIMIMLHSESVGTSSGAPTIISK